MKYPVSMAALATCAALGLAQPAWADNSLITIEQIGGDSSATITQNGPAKVALLNQNGGSNHATISQTTFSGGYVDLDMIGSGNVAYVTQSGELFNPSANTATLGQFGDRNSLNMVQEAWAGVVNTMAVTQSGNDNSAILRQTGSDNDMTLTQEFGNNSADITQTGYNQSISIAQMGGSSVIISQTQ